MTSSEITLHLERYREKQERIASEERARLVREEEIFRDNCRRCVTVLQDIAGPMLRNVADLLGEFGHETRLHPVLDHEHTTERTQLKTVEYSTALAVEHKKGQLILRIIASPQTLQITSFVGIPHSNCSSVFHAGSGPLSETEEVVNRGISYFMDSAFPIR